MRGTEGLKKKERWLVEIYVFLWSLENRKECRVRVGKPRAAPHLEYLPTKHMLERGSKNAIQSVDDIQDLIQYNADMLYTIHASSLCNI